MKGLQVRNKVANAVARLLHANTAEIEPRLVLGSTFPVAQGFSSGFLDHLHIDASGLLRLEGWCRDALAEDQSPVLSLDGRVVPLLRHFRFRRTDVLPFPDSPVMQTGAAWEYLIVEQPAGSLHSIELRLPDSGVSLEFKADTRFVLPHYSELFASEQVFHREEIYGSGPPNRVVHADVWELARRLDGPVLDFGCGRGTLVSRLDELGIEAHGLELDSVLLRSEIPAAIAGSITLYDGSFPAPFADQSFRSIICSEVLEHIPDYRAAVADIARIAREKVIFTVPDASAIPLGFRHGLIPWHLLEGTHLNFFSQRSLEILLQPFFRRIEFGRAGPSTVNDTLFYVSLTATCFK